MPETSLLYNTGLRVGELCGLNREDVRSPARGWAEVQVVGKQRRVRWVPINRHAREALAEYLASRRESHPALFLNRNGGRFSERGVALLVNRYLRRIGVSDRSGPHLLRHTFATHSLRTRPAACSRTLRARYVSHPTMPNSLNPSSNK